MTISTLNGTLLAEKRWDECDEGCWGFYSFWRFDFQGGILRLNLSTGGIAILLLNYSITEKIIDNGRFSGYINESIVAFEAPWDLSENLPTDRRIAAKIEKSDGKFSALFFDDNFHLLTEKHNVKNIDIQIPSGQSDAINIVLLNEDGGSYSNIEFYYCEASEVSQTQEPYYLYLIFLIILIIVVVWTIFRI